MILEEYFFMNSKITFPSRFQYRTLFSTFYWQGRSLKIRESSVIFILQVTGEYKKKDLMLLFLTFLFSFFYSDAKGKQNINIEEAIPTHQECPFCVGIVHLLVMKRKIKKKE